MQKPLISVVMSVFNEPRSWLIPAIESVLKQTHSHLQMVIVLDDPTHQDAREIINDYLDRDDRIEAVWNESNLGLVESLNRALGQCKGQYIARMDADDECLPHRLEAQLEFLLGSNLDLVGSSVIYIDEHGRELSKSAYILSSERALKKLAERRTGVLHPTWLMKRIVADTLEGYRHLPTAEDYDFLCRAYAAGFRVSNVPMVLLKYRLRASSVSSKNAYLQHKMSKYVRLLYRERRLTGRDSYTVNGVLAIMKRDRCRRTYEMLSRCQRRSNELPLPRLVARMLGIAVWCVYPPNFVEALEELAFRCWHLHTTLHWERKSKS